MNLHTSLLYLVANGTISSTDFMNCLRLEEFVNRPLIDTTKLRKQCEVDFHKPIIGHKFKAIVSLPLRAEEGKKK